MKSHFTFFVTLYFICTHIQCNIDSEGLKNQTGNRTLKNELYTVRNVTGIYVYKEFDLVNEVLKSEKNAVTANVLKGKLCLKNVNKCMQEDSNYQGTTARLSSYLFGLMPPFDLSAVEGISQVCQQSSQKYVEDLNLFQFWALQTLARLIGGNRIRTTPYHPQSNGLVERWHRTLKAALMCNAQTPWSDLLPTVLLGLRTAYKEDLKASPAEMLFGSPIRLPGEFFVAEDTPADPQIFIEKFREHIRTIRPTPTAHHKKSRPFILKSLHDCTHVFKRVASVKRPLEQPYTAPHEVIKRIDDRVFIVKINGEDKAVSVDMLKPAFVIKTDISQTDLTHQIFDQTRPQQNMTPDLDRPLKTYANVTGLSKKKVSFPSVLGQVTGEGIVVATPSQQLPPPNTRRRTDEPVCEQRRRRKLDLTPRTLY